MTQDLDFIIGDNSKKQLTAIVERVERLEEEKAALASDIKEVFEEAKGSGFDTKIVRQVIRIRKMDLAARKTQLDLLDTYLNALGVS